MEIWKDPESLSAKGWILFFSILGTIFWIVLIISKLIGTNDSSWWLILAPLWIPLAVFIVLLLAIGSSFLDQKLRK